MTITWIPTESDEGIHLVCYVSVCFAIIITKWHFSYFLFSTDGQYWTTIYIELRYVNDLTDLYEYVLGMSCFFATIKLISICQYDRRLSLFIRNDFIEI